MPSAELEGVTIHYQSAGDGDPVVFVPGFVTTLRLFDGQMEAVSRRFRAVRYDLRGQGESSAPADAYATADHARDLRALIEHLNLGRSHIVGASLGGAIAIHFALEHPELVRTLTLAGAVVDGFPGWPAEYADRLRAARKLARGEGGADAALAAWLGHPFFAATRDLPKLTASAVRAAAAVWTGAPRTAPGSSSDWERISAITPPTMVVVGEHEVEPVRGVAAALKTGVPGVTYHEIPGAGHLPAWDAPEEFTRVLLEFLARPQRR